MVNMVLSLPMGHRHVLFINLIKPGTVSIWVRDP